MNCVFIVRFV